MQLNSVENNKNQLYGLKKPILNLQFGRMIMHIGEKIEKICREKGLSSADVGKLIARSRQTVDNIFTRKSIDTDLLMKLSEVLDYDFFALYRRSKEIKEYKHLREELSQVKEEKEVYYHTVQNNLDYIKSLKSNLENLQEEKSKSEKSKTKAIEKELKCSLLWPWRSAVFQVLPN